MSVTPFTSSGYLSRAGSPRTQVLPGPSRTGRAGRPAGARSSARPRRRLLRVTQGADGDLDPADRLVQVLDAGTAAMVTPEEDLGHVLPTVQAERASAVRGRDLGPYGGDRSKPDGGAVDQVRTAPCVGRGPVRPMADGGLSQPRESARSRHGSRRVGGGFRRVRRGAQRAGLGGGRSRARRAAVARRARAGLALRAVLFRPRRDGGRFGARRRLPRQCDLGLPRLPAAPRLRPDLRQGFRGPTLVERSRGAAALVVGMPDQTGRLSVGSVGSVAHHCLNHATCPVVVVPAATLPPAPFRTTPAELHEVTTDDDDQQPRPPASRAASARTGMAGHRAVACKPVAAEVLPVSHQLFGRRISFRTSPYGVLAALTNPTMVAFEIDDIDMEAGTGGACWCGDAPGGDVAPHAGDVVEARGVFPWRRARGTPSSPSTRTASTGARRRRRSRTDARTRGGRTTGGPDPLAPRPHEDRMRRWFRQVRGDHHTRRRTLDAEVGRRAPRTFHGAPRHSDQQRPVAQHPGCGSRPRPPRPTRHAADARSGRGRRPVAVVARTCTRRGPHPAGTRGGELWLPQPGGALRCTCRPSDPGGSRGLVGGAPSACGGARF